MNKCSLCGRKISNKNSRFGSTCLKNMFILAGLNKIEKSKTETVLNNKISKLYNKILLRKSDKILLTNRYLALQLLNKVPISAYDKNKKSIEEHIQIIGTTKKTAKQNNILTLKQAHEIYKLYNKFQKIKNKSNEVDKNYIQNFLFENLSFVFSTYYRNKKYLSGVIADIQYFLWKTIVLWQKEKFPLGTDFIDYSLQKNPKDRIITEGKIIEEIKKDSKFIEKINNILESNNDKMKINITEGLNYESSDLFLALNNTTINVIGNKENNKWNLNITIKDRYDFTDFKEIDEYFNDDIIKGLLGSAANNAAMISIASGVMHEYNVIIQFTIDDWSVTNE